MRSPRLLLLIAVLLAGPAHASWWNAGWRSRVPITVDLGPEAAGATPVVVLVRLFPGNLDFSLARPDGADLRFVDGDDRTLLSFHAERFDPLLGEALVWVRLESVPPGGLHRIWLYLDNPEAEAVSDPAATLGDSARLVYHFGDRRSPLVDSSRRASHAGGGIPGDGLIGNGLSLGPDTALALPVEAPAGAPLTIETWVNPRSTSGLLLSWRGQDGAVRLGLDDGRLYLDVQDHGPARRVMASSGIVPGRWTHLALTAGQHSRLYVDGKDVATLEGPLPGTDGRLALGGEPGRPAIQGTLDELRVWAEERSAASVRLSAVIQGPEGGPVALGPAEISSGSLSEHLALLGGLLAEVSVDGWIIIGLIGVMGVASVMVMVTKAGYLRRVERANRRFRDARGKLTVRKSDLAASPLHRLAGIAQGLVDSLPPGTPLSSEGLQAVRAQLESGLVAEHQRAMRGMVMLTVAISGGPFLGLLGTVVGVMVTFASISASGEVNISAIAPGIGAALTTTVAGLCVAIPALYAYNWLLTRVKNLTALMEVYIDELITNLAWHPDAAARRPMMAVNGSTPELRP